MKHLTTYQIHNILDEQYKGGFMDPNDFDNLNKTEKLVIIRKYVNTCLANYALTIGENPNDEAIIKKCINLIKDYSACLYGIDRLVDEYHN